MRTAHRFTNVAVGVLLISSVSGLDQGSTLSFGTTVASQEEVEVSAAQLEQFQNAPLVFVGELTKVVEGPVSRSLPPIYHFTLEVDAERILKGDMKIGLVTNLHFSARQNAPPNLPKGESIVVFAKKSRRMTEMTGFQLATAETIDLFEALQRVPVGWSINEKGKPVSPWPHQAGTDWSKIVLTEETLECAGTGRPATVLPEGVALSVEKVPPPKEIKWTNPDGDGQYTITLTNSTKESIAVNSLLADGEKVLWSECLLIQCQNKTYPLNDSNEKMPQTVTPVILKPSESISTTVNALSLDGPKWPQGGYRIEFQFALGQTSVAKSFYYMSRHHDAIRAKAMEEKK